MRDPVVIEAVTEILGLKKKVFAELEGVLSPEAVLLTNTSALSITEMAADLQHPERVVGMHFFNPVAQMPLVEIIQAAKTDDAALATAFGRSLSEVGAVWMVGGNIRDHTRVLTTAIVLETGKGQFALALLLASVLLTLALVVNVIILRFQGRPPP